MSCVNLCGVLLTVQETLSDLDRNKDGFLTLEEYIGMLHGHGIVTGASCACTCMPVSVCVCLSVWLSRMVQWYVYMCTSTP